MGSLAHVDQVIARHTEARHARKLPRRGARFLRAEAGRLCQLPRCRVDLSRGADVVAAGPL